MVFMLCECEPGNLAPLSFIEILSLMMADELRWYRSGTSNCITLASHLSSFSRLRTYFILWFQRTGSGCEAGCGVCCGGEKRGGKLRVN